jgi:hypothetical protein
MMKSKTVDLDAKGVSGGHWRFLSGLILLIGVAYLIGQNWSLSKQVADLESSLKDLDSRVRSGGERIPSVPALQPSLVISPGIAEEIADRVLARMSIPAKPSEPARAAGEDKSNTPVSPSEERANVIVDTAIRAGKLRQEDVLAIRELLAKSGDVEALRHVGSRIAAAINRDQIQPESPEVVFP